MRKNIAAANWKMNMLQDEAKAYLEDLASLKSDSSNTKTIIGVPFIYLSQAITLAKDLPNVYIAAQNVHQENKGAFTGEISPTMLSSLNVDYVIVGHSERREYFQESNELIKKKVDAALDAGLNVIFCCGESLQTREAGAHEKYVTNQIQESILHLDEKNIKRVVIAYEPIWAIGTGLTASPEDANAMHRAIRTVLSEKYGTSTAESISILYGGSVKPSNAEVLFAQEHIDGGLVGGASLKVNTFKEIVNAF